MPPKSVLAAVVVLGAVVVNAAAQPSIVVSSKTLDVGEVWKGSQVTREILVANVGTEPLELQGVQAGCSCTVAKLDTKRLGPGDSVPVAVTFDSNKRRVGPSTVNIVIRSNDPKTPQLVIPLKAEVKTVTELVPPDALRRFVYSAGDRLTLEAKLRVARDAPVTLEFVACEPPVFDVTLETIEAGKMYRLTAKTKEPVAASGTVSATIKLKTDVPEQPILELPANVVVRQRVQVTPTALFVSARHGARTQVIRISDFGDTPLEIERIETNHPDITAEVAEEEIDRSSPRGVPSHTRKRILLHLPEAATLGDEDIQIEVFTTDPEFARIAIPVTTDRERYREYFLNRLSDSKDRAARRTSSDLDRTLAN